MSLIKKLLLLEWSSRWYLQVAIVVGLFGLLLLWFLGTALSYETRLVMTHTFNLDQTVMYSKAGAASLDTLGWLVTLRDGAIFYWGILPALITGYLGWTIDIVYKCLRE